MKFLLRKKNKDTVDRSKNDIQIGEFPEKSNGNIKNLREKDLISNSRNINTRSSNRKEEK